MKTAYIGLGSNIRPRQQTVTSAIRLLSSEKGIRLCAVSPLYETEPIGGPKQAAYLNAVVSIQTTLGPLPLFRRLLAIEKKLGRQRRVKWGPRTIDLDLLAHGQTTRRTKELVLPHPHYHERRFVLIPFSNVAKKFIHPVLNQTNETLLRRLTPQGQRVTIFAPWKTKQFSPSKTKNR